MTNTTNIHFFEIDLSTVKPDIAVALSLSRPIFPCCHYHWDVCSPLTLVQGKVTELSACDTVAYTTCLFQP